VGQRLKQPLSFLPTSKFQRFADPRSQVEELPPRQANSDSSDRPWPGRDWMREPTRMDETRGRLALAEIFGYSAGFGTFPFRPGVSSSVREAVPKRRPPEVPGLVETSTKESQEEVFVKIRRRYTSEGRSPYEGIDFDRRVSEIRNPDGSIVFRLETSKSRPMVAGRHRHPRPEVLPQGRRQPARRRSTAGRASPCPRGETSARQVFPRPRRARWTHWPASTFGYSTPPGDAPSPTTTRCADARDAGGRARTRRSGSPPGLHWRLRASAVPGRRGHYYDPTTVPG
jgi:hypothetical protein